MITDGFTYAALLLFLAGILVTLEKKSGWRFFNVCPAVVLLYLFAMLFCTLGVWDMEATGPTYIALKNPLTYAMVFAMLLRCDIRKVIKLGPRMLIGFFSASLSIMSGFILAYLIMKGVLGADSWKGLAALCGSWLGGSGNMVAVQSALNIGEADMGYALVIDSIDYSIWVMFLLWFIRMAPRFNKWTKADTTALDAVSNRLEEENIRSGKQSGAEKTGANTSKIEFQGLILLAGTSLMFSAVAQYIGGSVYSVLPFLDKSTWTILLITLFGLTGAVTPLGRVAGSTEVSNLLLYSVVALLASRASLLELRHAPAWILTGFIILAIHAVIMVLFCKVLQIDLFTASVASLANIGGTASAPILAGSYSGSLVPVGILMALLGYVIGTPCGIMVARIMQELAGL